VTCSGTPHPCNCTSPPASDGALFAAGGAEAGLSLSVSHSKFFGLERQREKLVSRLDWTFQQPVLQQVQFVLSKHDHSRKPAPRAGWRPQVS
jgi:hypothetical protein